MFGLVMAAHDSFWECQSMASGYSLLLPKTSTHRLHVNTIQYPAYCLGLVGFLLVINPSQLTWCFPAIAGAASRLKIFEDVDLLRPGAFDAAIAGCHAVLHTASPFYFAGGSEAGVRAGAEPGEARGLVVDHQIVF